MFSHISIRWGLPASSQEKSDFHLTLDPWQIKTKFQWFILTGLLGIRIDTKVTATASSDYTLVFRLDGGGFKAYQHFTNVVHVLNKKISQIPHCKKNAETSLGERFHPNNSHIMGDLKAGFLRSYCSCSYCWVFLAISQSEVCFFSKKRHHVVNEKLASEA